MQQGPPRMFLTGTEYNVCVYVLEIRTLVVHTSSDLLALTMNHAVHALYCLLPASATDWFIKGHAMNYHVHVIVHIKDLQLFVIRVEHNLGPVSRLLSVPI